VALSRVLLNLTTNALKFTDQGYVEIVAQEIVTRDRIASSSRCATPAAASRPTKITTLFQPLRKESGRRGQLFSQADSPHDLPQADDGDEVGAESRVADGDWGTRFYFELDLPVVAARRSDPRGGRRTSGAHPCATVAPCPAQ